MEQRDGQCLSGHCRDTPAHCQISDAVEKVGFFACWGSQTAGSIWGFEEVFMHNMSSWITIYIYVYIYDTYIYIYIDIYIYIYIGIYNYGTFNNITNY